MKSKIHLEEIVAPRVNMRVVIDHPEFPFTVGDVIEVAESNLLVKDVEGNEIEVSKVDCFVPYMLHDNGYKYYLSLAWREHLVESDLEDEFHFMVGKTGTNEGKAIRIKGHAVVAGEVIYIPWSTNDLAEDVKLMGYKNDLTFATEYH